MPINEELKSEIETAIAANIEESKVVDDSKTVDTQHTEKQVEINDTEVVNQDTAKKEDDQETETVEKPIISDRAIEDAIKAGFSIQEARSYPSEDLLINAVRRINDIVAQSQKSEQEPQEEIDIFKDFPSIDTSKYDEDSGIEDVAKSFEMLKTIIQNQQNELKELKQYAVQSQDSVKDSVSRDVEQWFDTSVKSLGDDYKELLGEGSYKTLKLGSPQLAKRDELGNTVSVLLAGYQARGIEPPDRDEVFKKAVQLTFADEISKMNERKLTTSLQKRSSQNIQRANSQSGKKQLDPSEAVAEIINKKHFNK